MPKRLKQTLQSMIDLRSSEWLDRQIVRLGKDSTQLIDTGTPGLLWARLSNGKPIKVHTGTTNVPSQFDLHLVVGRKKIQPTVWQVILTLEDYDAPAGGGELTYHHKQHEEGGGDRLNLSWKQIVARSVRVKTAASFIVRVFGDPDLTPNGYVLIPTQDRDLSSYVPTTGALFVAIESDDDGVLSENDGTPFAAPGAGTEADYPVPAAGKYTRAFVLLFEGQTTLLDEHIIIPKPPSFNPANYSGISHVHALDDLTDVNAPTPTDAQVLTWDAYAEEWVTVVDLDTDGTLAANSDTKIATQKATKTYVDNAVTQIVYVPDTLTVPTGTVDSGDVASLAELSDGDVLAVSEVTGTPGFEIIGDISSGVVTFNHVWAHVRYAGGAGHTVNLQLYNYDTATWDTLTAISESGDLDFIDIPVIDPIPYISSGAARIRIYHASSGNPSHDMFVDFLGLIKAGFGGSQDHGSLSGLLEDDHTQYIKHSLATAANDFLVASGVGAFVAQTLAQTISTLRTLLDGVYIISDGWEPRSETWTRTGNLTFTISGDVTAAYRKGTKIRYKDGGAYEYGVIASSSYSSPNTTVTLIDNSDYAMAAATITDTYISYIENPEGYPHWFNWSANPQGFGGGQQPTDVTYQWATVGTTVFITYVELTNGTSNATTFTATAPVAAGHSVTGVAGTLVDNGALLTVAGRVVMSAGGTTITFRTNMASGAWTNINGKRAVATWFYEF